MRQQIEQLDMISKGGIPPNNPETGKLLYRLAPYRIAKHSLQMGCFRLRNLRCSIRQSVHSLEEPDLFYTARPPEMLLEQSRYTQ